MLGCYLILLHSCLLTDDINYNDCLETYMEDQIGCTLPWRKTAAEKTMETCQHYEELENLVNVTRMIAPLDDRQVAELTNCHRSCSLMSYFSK